MGHGNGTMADPSFHILETHLNRMLGKRVNPLGITRPVESVILVHI